MKSVPLFFLFGLLLISCGKKSGEVDSTFVISSSNTVSVGSGGTFLGGHSSDGEKFFIALADNTDSYEMTLDNGDWNFYSVSWDGDFAFSGPVQCEKIQASLDGGEIEIALNMTNAKCEDPFFADPDMSLVDWDPNNIGFFNFTLRPCLNFGEGLNDFAKGCSGNTVENSYALGLNVSYRLSVLSHINGAPHSSTITSPCLSSEEAEAGSFISLSPDIWTPLSLPVGGELKYDVGIHTYADAHCRDFMGSHKLSSFDLYSETKVENKNYRIFTDPGNSVHELYFIDNFTGTNASLLSDHIIDFHCAGPLAQKTYCNLTKPFYDDVEDWSLYKSAARTLEDIFGNPRYLSNRSQGKRAHYWGDSNPILPDFIFTAKEAGTFMNGREITVNNSTAFIENETEVTANTITVNETDFNSFVAEPNQEFHSRLTGSDLSNTLDIILEGDPTVPLFLNVPENDSRTIILEGGEEADIDQRIESIVSDINFAMAGPFISLIEMNSSFTSCEEMIGSYFEKSFNLNLGDDNVQIDMSSTPPQKAGFDVRLENEAHFDSDGELDITYDIYEFSCANPQKGYFYFTDVEQDQQWHRKLFWDFSDYQTSGDFSLEIYEYSVDGLFKYKVLSYVESNGNDGVNIWRTVVDEYNGEVDHLRREGIFTDVNGMELLRSEVFSDVITNETSFTAATVGDETFFSDCFEMTTGVGGAECVNLNLMEPPTGVITLPTGWSFDSVNTDFENIFNDVSP